MEVKEIKGLTDEEIKAKVAAVRREIVELKVKEAAKNMGRAPIKVRNLRKDIARMLTVLREREIEK